MNRPRPRHSRREVRKQLKRQQRKLLRKFDNLPNFGQHYIGDRIPHRIKKLVSSLRKYIKDFDDRGYPTKDERLVKYAEEEVTNFKKEEEEQ
jgi:hypothetical protein